MSEKINDGGPAFPIHSGLQYEGMSLRDWFAGLEQLTDCETMSGKCAETLLGRKIRSFDVDPLGNLHDEAEARAKLRYMRADAMLRARRST